MNETGNHANRLLISMLRDLRQIPDRDIRSALAGRETFLRQARSLKELSSQRVILTKDREGVSPEHGVRLNEWIQKIRHTILERRQPVMINTLIGIVLSIGLLFGGASATVYAAQTSLPNDPLYGLKLFSEDARMLTTSKTQARLALTLEFINRRVEELAGLPVQNAQSREKTANRLDYQLSLALQLTAGLEDEDIQPALEQVRNSLQQQERKLAGLQLQNPGDPLMAQLRQRLQQMIHLVESGSADPQQLRDQLWEWERQQQRDQEYKPQTDQGQGNLATPHPQATPGPNNYGAGSHQPSETPQTGYGPGPQNPQPTPQQGGQFGPGPFDPTEAPSGGYGPGENNSGENPGNDGNGGQNGGEQNGGAQSGGNQENGGQNTSSDGPGPEGNVTGSGSSLNLGTGSGSQSGNGGTGGSDQPMQPLH